MKALRNENGLALLSALLTVALLTLIVVEMTDVTFVHSHLTRNAGNALAAQLLARSGQVGAEEALRQAKTDPDIQLFVDNFIDGPPLSLPTAQGHLVQISIRDESGRLNLNDALDTPEPFENLFADLDIPTSILEAIQARLEADAETNLRNLSGDCSLPMPCEPRAGELRSFDELRTIRGVNDAVLARLRTYFTAYPRSRGDKKINIRTARPEVLAAAGCEDVDSLPKLPRTKDDAEAWNEAKPCANAKLNPEVIDHPKLYSVVTIATVGDATQSVEATVEPGKDRLSWKQRPVWGVGPGGVP